ncbi:MAG TPA: tetratricopeptide repeat protein [Flavisolibacter sp.]|nr:tetratricopeptide repeat protein [Flavisolibacter sp.]
MKYFLIIFSFICFQNFSQAQTQQQTPQEIALAYMHSGDFDNAILVINRALIQDPNNTELQKNLVLSYYYKKDYARALEKVKPMLENDDADVQVYQLAGNVYKALEEVKEADKMYKKALKRYPKSGALYSEYGELLWEKKDFSAIQLWEKGIESDPAYPGNYYNAALYYYFTKDKVWTLLYGEIFVNMEYLTPRATEIKKLLLSTYKEKLFIDVNTEKKSKDKTSDFARAVVQTLTKQAPLTNNGITIETLNMIRTRFLLDWFANYASKYPFKLFDYQQQLVKQGMFEAYNQWLFGTVDNLSAFDQWTKNNNEAYNKFTTYQKNRVFKMPSGQHYQNL